MTPDEIEKDRARIVMTDADLKQLGRWLIHDSGRGWFISPLRGHTVLLGKAGRFSWEEALSYAFPEGWKHPRSGVTLQHEATVFEPTAAPTPEVLDLRAEVARLREALEFYADKAFDGYDVSITDYGLSTELGEIIKDGGDRARAVLGEKNDG